MVTLYLSCTHWVSQLLSYSFLEFLHTTCLKVPLINSLGAQLWVSVADNLQSIHSFKPPLFLTVDFKGHAIFLLGCQFETEGKRNLVKTFYQNYRNFTGLFLIYNVILSGSSLYFLLIVHAFCHHSNLESP